MRREIIEGGSFDILHTDLGDRDRDRQNLFVLHINALDHALNARQAIVIGCNDIQAQAGTESLRRRFGKGDLWQCIRDDVDGPRRDFLA